MTSKQQFEKVYVLPEKQKESEAMRIGRQMHEEFEKAWRAKWQADLIATVF